MPPISYNNPRFQTQDPTKQGYFEVIDTSERTGPWEETDESGKVIKHEYGGQTYMLALYTPMLEEATDGRIKAEAEANALASQLNATPAPPANSRARFQPKDADFEVYDRIAKVTVATFRQRCPQALQKRDALLAKLNR